MARMIKAPNVTAQPYNIINKTETLEQAEQRARRIIHNAREQEKSIIDSAYAQAETTLSDAREKIESMLEDAENQRSGIIASAEEEGFQQGYNQGLKQAQDELRGIINEMARISKDANRQLQDLILNQEHELRKLVVSIVRRIVSVIVEEDDELVVRTVQTCLKQAADRQRIRILIHPDDEEKVREHCDDYRRAFDEIEEIAIEPDPRVGRGGVIVETGYGGVDARIERQLDIMEEAIEQE